MYSSVEGLEFIWAKSVFSESMVQEIICVNMCAMMTITVIIPGFCDNQRLLQCYWRARTCATRNHRMCRQTCPEALQGREDKG